MDDLSDDQIDAMMRHLNETTSDVYVWASTRALPVVRTQDLGRGVRVDLDEHDGVIGVEVCDSEGVVIDGRQVEVGRKPPMSRWRQAWVALTRPSPAFSPKHPPRRRDPE